ncbi:alpha/beta hydrolase [Kovacikia minuta CCNUW1]|uniref:alpha/beta hydrolase n=1 Tax=Kovacikia minuta TaxID=2931930 RepID=UPI001CCA10BD|nr:alpha/beta hydrolase [Kovacikia minuta]UBF24823.1 alpha/beta hydrolase [Kovacikia minuta CCNUW1]
MQWAKQFGGLRLAVGAIGAGLMSALVACPAFGAERIVLAYGVLERSIPIESLETYARTGVIDSELAWYAQRASPEQLTQLKQGLLTPIPLGAVEVSQFLYTSIGERLLDRLGEVIQMDSRQSGFYAIRAALILAAADPEGFTPLNVLRKFPSSQIEINLTRSLEIANELESLINQSNRTYALVNEQSVLEALAAPPSLPPIDLQSGGAPTWDRQTITLDDRSRNRSFPADVYLPRSPNPHPVIVISHGLGSDRSSFAYLAQYLASKGFVVAVPEHPGSSSSQLQALLDGRAAEVTNPREFIDRPLDIKFLLDELTRRAQSDPAFQGRLNLQQIGVIGQSFGGYTALALAGAPIQFQQLQTNCRNLNNSLNVSLLLQCLALQLPNQPYDLSDPRVKAAIAINPIDSSILGRESLSQIKIPVMIVAGSADTVAPALPEQIQSFTWLTVPDKYLVLMNGGTHFSTIAESPTAVIPIPDQAIGPSPALARHYIETLSLIFFQSYTANRANYRPYLSASYIRTISQEPLRLSLVRSLTAEQLARAIGDAPL